MRRLLLPLALLVSTVATTPIKAQPEGARARMLDEVREFARFFKKYKQLAQKIEAVLALESTDCPEAVAALTPHLRHKAPEIRSAVKRVLAGYKSPTTFDALLEKIKEMSDREMRAEFFDVLSRAGQNKLRKTIGEIWEADKGLDVREKYQIARAYERLGGKGFETLLTALAKDRAYEVRVAACDAIGKSKLKSVGKDLVPLIDDKVWQVQAAAIKMHGQLRTREAVEPLIALLKLPGRLKQDAAESLFLITTRDFGLDHATWEKQWKFLTSIPNFRLPNEAELKKAKEARAKADKMYKKGPGQKSFAGIPTHSTRVIFIIDVSASMDDLVTDRKRFKGYPSFRKIEIVKKELIDTINGLDNNTYFNVLAFAKKTKSWKRWLTRASISQRASAISFVKRLEPLGVAKAGGFGAAGGDDSGKTNTYSALMRAFDLDPAKGMVLTGRGDKKPPKLDTIYFLTDGRPSIGKYVDTDDILREVKKINDVRGVVIHAISIGEFEATFMKQLAAQNGGVFVDLGG